MAIETLNSPSKATILRRIELCLRLTESPELGEALNAAAIARQLAEKYNIALEILEEKGKLVLSDSIIDYVSSYREPFKKDLDPWEQRLAKVVADHYGCRVFLASFEGKEQLNIAGRYSDIEMVDSMFSWLQTCLFVLIVQDGKSKSKEWRDGYMLGALHQIDQKFEEAKDDARKGMLKNFKEAPQAIIKIDGRLSKIDKFLENRRFEAYSIETDNNEGFDKGFDAAKSLNLTKVEELK